MNPETIRDYLQRAEMSEAQAEALSRIFWEMTTRSDVARLEDRIASFERNFELRFRAFEDKAEQQFRAFEKWVEQRFIAFEEKADQRFIAFEEKMDLRYHTSEELTDRRFRELAGSFDERLETKISELRADITWKLIAVVGFFATASAILNFFAA